MAISCGLGRRRRPVRDASKWPRVFSCSGHAAVRARLGRKTVGAPCAIMTQELIAEQEERAQAFHSIVSMIAENHILHRLVSVDGGIKAEGQQSPSRDGDHFDGLLRRSCVDHSVPRYDVLHSSVKDLDSDRVHFKGIPSSLGALPKLQTNLSQYDQQIQPNICEPSGVVRDEHTNCAYL